MHDHHCRIAWISGVFIAVVLAVSIGCGGGGGGDSVTPPAVCVEFTAADAPATGLVTARSATQSTCELLVLDVLVTDVNDLYAAEFDVNFNSNVVRYDGHIGTSSFLGSDGATVEIIGPSSDTTGSFTLGITRVNVNDGMDFTTTQTLVQLRFRAAADSGSGAITFQNGALFGSEEPPVEKPGLTWSGGTASIL